MQEWEDKKNNSKERQAFFRTLSPPIFSFIKDINTVSYKHHLFKLLTLSQSFSYPLFLNARSTLHWNGEKIFVWRGSHHPPPFLSHFKYTSEPSSWIDIHLKTIQSCIDQLIQWHWHSLLLPLFLTCLWAFVWILQHQTWLQ